MWDAIREAYPEYVVAYCRLAYVAMDTGDYDEAESLYRKAFMLAPTFPDARFGLAEALTNLGRLDDALSLLGELPSQDVPKAVAMRILRAQIYTELGEYRKAKEEYEAVIRSAPRTPQAYFGLSLACDRLGEAEEAAKYRQEFDRRTEAGGSSRHEAKGIAADLERGRQIAVSTFVAVGASYLRRDDLEEAEWSWRRAVEITPEDAVSRERLAMLYMEQQRLDEAVAELERLVQFNPEYLNGHLMLGKLHSDQGRADRAEKAFREVIRLAPDRGAGYAALAHHYLKAGSNLTAASESAKRAVELEPTAKHYYLLGLCAMKSGNTEKGRAAVEQAVALEPENPMYRQTIERMGQR